MPRITRIHFAGLGHKDARFPSLTLDLRDPQGRATDSIIWAENGTGKSSLLSLYFSTFKPNQRLFLGKQAESKARELGDYVGDRDLGFVVTEWDTTDDRAEASLLADGPRNMLLVGQALSWNRLDRSTGELRRLFFSLRAGRDINFDSLPVLGLGEPVTSFEAFREWLVAKEKSEPRLQVNQTTNHTEWREHLESIHLDPELFTFQLRMNEREGGINNLFNELKRDADFIHEFLKLGFDPATAAEVQKNLGAFLPKLRRREALELQLEFNQKLLVDLGLFVQQLGNWESAKLRSEAAEREAGALWAALLAAQARFVSETTRYAGEWERLEREGTTLESARTANGRRQNFMRRLKAELEVEEAEAALKRCKQALTAAQHDKRLVAMAMVLAELRAVAAAVAELERALERERTQAKPVLEVLQALGGAYKFQVERAAGLTKTHQSTVGEQRETLRREKESLAAKQRKLIAERSTKQTNRENLEQHFDLRESRRDRLRADGWLEAKEAASDALSRWRDQNARAKEAEETATRQLKKLRAEEDVLSADATRLAGEIAAAASRVSQLGGQVGTAEVEEERIATHEQMRAAVEVSRADLNLAQTAERLSERAASLLRQILHRKIECVEDERTQLSMDKHRLFPAHQDVEALVEKLQGAGVRSATTAAQWLAYNLTDPHAAADLLASDPARFGGVMFDATVDGPRLREMITALRTEHLAVVVAPRPDAVSKPTLGGGETTVVLPRHAAGFNHTAAAAEAERLVSVISTRNKELETLHTQLDATKTLRDELGKWLAEFGGPKLGALRGKFRGEQQSLASQQESKKANSDRLGEVKAAIAAATTAGDQARINLERAAKAIAQLESFFQQFDADYDSKRAQHTQLGSRLQIIGVEWSELEEQSRELENREQPLDERLMALGVKLAGYQKEVADIVYAGSLPASVADSLDNLRTRYRTECQQYEGRFLNSKAQGELGVKQTERRDKEQKLASEFTGLDQAAAEAKLTAGDLVGHLQAAESAVAEAQRAEGAADFTVKEARKKSRELGLLGEQERPAVPATSAAAALELEKLVSESETLQTQLENNRKESQSANEAKSLFSQRSTEYGRHVDRLRDLNVIAGIAPAELPDDDAQVGALTEERVQRLKKARGETRSEQDKLQALHKRILDLTQEDRFARAMDLPVRSLFAHLPVEELVLNAADKQKAVLEDTLVLQADLEQMNQHRETLVESLLNVCDQAVRLLQRAEKWSVLPANMGEWAGQPFLRIRLRMSPNRADNLARLKSLVDFIFAEGKIPQPVELVFRALTALVGETGVDATILKPETQRRTIRYPVREMGGWSEGERTTVAILLYCTLVKIRAHSRGHAGRLAEVSALLLDNPIGPCSKPEFLQMHRWIASQLGVQLIYATGINDPAALSVFPNRVRLAKNRFIPATGELAVGLQTDSDESMIQDIRIFDDSGEDDVAPPLANDA